MTKMALTLIDDLGRYVKEGTKSIKRYGNYLCSFCESETVKASGDVNSGLAKSCGCQERKTHGLSNTRIWRIWVGMHSRCNDLDNPNYGGKGIRVCKEWAAFKVFHKDMSEGYAKHLEIDRMDSAKDYCKSNCQWLTRSENAGKDRRKLSTEQVKEIRVHKTEGSMSHSEMARYYKVSKSTIQQLVENRSYTDLKYY